MVAYKFSRSYNKNTLVGLVRTIIESPVQTIWKALFNDFPFPLIHKCLHTVTSTTTNKLLDFIILCMKKSKNECQVIKHNHHNDKVTMSSPLYRHRDRHVPSYSNRCKNYILLDLSFSPFLPPLSLLPSSSLPPPLSLTLSLPPLLSFTMLLH